MPVQVPFLQSDLSGVQSEHPHKEGKDVTGLIEIPMKPQEIQKFVHDLIQARATVVDSHDGAGRIEVETGSNSSMSFLPRRERNKATSNVNHTK